MKRRTATGHIEFDELDREDPGLPEQMTSALSKPHTSMGSFDSMRTDIKANFEDVNYMGNALMGGAADGFMDETINETPYAYSTFVYDKFGGGMTET